MSKYLKTHHRQDFVDAVGDRRAGIAIHAIGGAIIGVGEVVFLPLDLLKVRGQTALQTASREPFSAKLFFSHFQTSSNGGHLAAFRALYRGAGWTTIRNSVGCFALFGASAVVKETVFGLEDYHDASLFQDFVSSSVAAAACVFFA